MVFPGRQMLGWLIEDRWCLIIIKNPTFLVMGACFRRSSLNMIIGRDIWLFCVRLRYKGFRCEVWLRPEVYNASGLYLQYFLSLGVECSCRCYFMGHTCVDILWYLVCWYVWVLLWLCMLRVSFSLVSPCSWCVWFEYYGIFSHV